MPGKIYSSTELDSDGRQFVLSDNILHVKYYDSSLEVWDKLGSQKQSWHTEIYSPNDTFISTDINTDRWFLTGSNTRTLEQADGSLLLGIERDEGITSLSSDGKWRLSGDFDIRLYIDWDSYYNEYRSVTRTFLKVGYDDSNAVRISFIFNGVDKFSFSSEVTNGRNIKYFDWKESGTSKSLNTFSAATQWTHFRVTREGSVLRTFVSDGDTEVQVGIDITEATMSNDLYVEFGLESKEYNTYRHNLTKFFVAEGNTTLTTKFFSPDRGTTQEFPPHIVMVVDSTSVSLIDEDSSKLWLRILIGADELVPDNNTKVAACNGVIYCTTPDGLIALDFPQDKIFKYKDSEIQVADEPVSLRNAGVTFRTFASSTGAMASNNIHGVYCRRVGSEDYIAITHDSGITVRRALASGVSNCSDGPIPGDLTSISEKGSLYWTGHDTVTGTGELSHYSNVTALATAGTTTFNRSGHYGTETSLPLLGSNITSFAVRTITGTDLLAVGTTEGISFINLIPASKSDTYGVTTSIHNPFVDSNFSSDVGVYWVPFYDGFIGNVSIYKSLSWATNSTSSLLLRSGDVQEGGYITVGTNFGVYQEVNLSGAERIYFDLNFCPVGEGDTVWEFQIVVGGTVVKSYNSSEGPFIKYTDSVDVLGFVGTHRVEFRIYFAAEVDGTINLSDYYLYITNLRISVGDPTYRVLPAGNAAIKDVLLQYDSEGHKIYFATAEGFGAVDLDHHSLDYFTPLEELVVDSTTENLSADFTRVEDEA